MLPVRLALLLLSAATICDINPSFALQLPRHSYHDITTPTLFLTRPPSYLTTSTLASGKIANFGTSPDHGDLLDLPTSCSNYTSNTSHTATTMVARAARASKNNPRGPAATRRDRTKGDRDGDLSMDGPVKGRGGRVGKSSGPANPRKDLTAGKGKGGILSATNQRAILKHAGAGDVAMRGPKSVSSRGLTELKITNWKKSKASTNPDGGVSSLITWLEKKASNRLGSRIRTVKIKKVCRRHYSYCYSGSRYTLRRITYSGPLSFATHLTTTAAIRNYNPISCGG